MATRRDLEERINVRAAKDQQFRSDLMGNPHATLKKELGLEIPADIKITVLEESGTQHYIVLPQKHSGAGEPEGTTGLLRILGGSRPTY
jgi:hypothetical protein